LDTGAAFFPVLEVSAKSGGKPALKWSRPQQLAPHQTALSGFPGPSKNQSLNIKCQMAVTS